MYVTTTTQVGTIRLSHCKKSFEYLIVKKALNIFTSMPDLRIFEADFLWIVRFKILN